MKKDELLELTKKVDEGRDILDEIEKFEMVIERIKRFRSYPGKSVNIVLPSITPGDFRIDREPTLSILISLFEAKIASLKNELEEL